MKKFICSVCGKEYTEKELDKYIECVNFCAGNLKKEKERIHAEYLANMNAALNRVKSAEEYYKEKLRSFMNEYPEEYKIHFDSSYKKENVTDNSVNNDCNDCNDCNDWLAELEKDIFSNVKTLEISSVTDKNGDEKTSIKLNGKDIHEDNVLNKLKNDPETQYIAKLLDIISK